MRDCTVSKKFLNAVLNPIVNKFLIVNFRLAVRSSKCDRRSWSRSAKCDRRSWSRSPSKIGRSLVQLVKKKWTIARSSIIHSIRKQNHSFNYLKSTIASCISSIVIQQNSEEKKKNYSWFLWSFGRISCPKTTACTIKFLKN